MAGRPADPRRWNPRSALNRLNAGGVPLVAVDQSGLALREGVLVDVRLLGDWASRVVSGDHSERDLAVTAWDLSQLDLLPGWYDDWVLLERERLRQRLLHALELVSRDRTRHGRYAEAADASSPVKNGLAAAAAGIAGASILAALVAPPLPRPPSR